MALMKATIKTLAAALALALVLTGAAGAATFKAGRGISLDLWVTWPDESRWSERETILPFPEWRKFIGPGEFDAIRASGFDMVRIPVDPSVFLSPETSALREDLYESVRESLDLAVASGLKAILDLHAIPAGPNRAIGTVEVLEDAALFDAYVDIVRRMARLAGTFDPQRVALELMNEPVTGCEGAEAAAWADKLKRLFAAARASALDTTLILSGACWGSAEGLAALDPAEFRGGNLIWSFHSYAPFILTHQGAGWTGDVSPYATGLPYPPHGVNEAVTQEALTAIRARVRAEAPLLRRSGIIAFVEEELEKIGTPEKLRAVMAEPFETVAGWARTHGIDPGNILLGEFGMIRQEYGHDFRTDPHWRAAYYRDMIGLAEDHGFAWSMWGHGGAFGVFEEFESRAAEPDVRDVVRGLPPS
ncbi:MAG: glycosyl hydrolase [Phyllobacteriaceae bacterium]|nr:glycosyl hydrolase [Phyllobacteriaceae bacterium]MBA92144.1 glycosyl hydrolase [Phyllobacteriaceae bacterium]